MKKTINLAGSTVNYIYKQVDVNEIDTALK